MARRLSSRSPVTVFERQAVREHRNGNRSARSAIARTRPGLYGVDCDSDGAATVAPAQSGWLKYGCRSCGIGCTGRAEPPAADSEVAALSATRKGFSQRREHIFRGASVVPAVREHHGPRVVEGLPADTLVNGPSVTPNIRAAVDKRAGVVLAGQRSSLSCLR